MRSKDLLKHTYTTVLLPFFRDYPAEPVTEKSSSGLYGARGDIRGRHTDNPAGCHSIWTSQWPTSLIPQFLRWMPFLSQPCQFILAWDRHQVCWIAYPVAWLNCWSSGIIILMRLHAMLHCWLYDRTGVRLIKTCTCAICPQNYLSWTNVGKRLRDGWLIEVHLEDGW